MCVCFFLSVGGMYFLSSALSLSLSLSSLFFVLCSLFFLARLLACLLGCGKWKVEFVCSGFAGRVSLCYERGVVPISMLKYIVYCV